MDNINNPFIQVFEENISKGIIKAIESVEKSLTAYLTKNKIKGPEDINTEYSSYIKVFKEYLISNYSECEEEVFRQWPNAPRIFMLASLIEERDEANEAKYMYEQLNQISKDNITVILEHISKLQRPSIIISNKVANLIDIIIPEDYYSHKEYMADCIAKLTKLTYIGGSLIIIDNDKQYGFNVFCQSYHALAQEYLDSLELNKYFRLSPLKSIKPPLILADNAQKQAEYLSIYGDIYEEEIKADPNCMLDNSLDAFKNFVAKTQNYEKIFSKLPDKSKSDINTVDKLIEKLRRNDNSYTYAAYITPKEECTIVPNDSSGNSPHAISNVAVQFRNLTLEALTKDGIILIICRHLVDDPHTKKNGALYFEEELEVYGLAAKNRKIYPLHQLALNKATHKYMETLLKIMEISPYTIYANYSIDTVEYHFSQPLMSSKEFDELF